MKDWIFRMCAALLNFLCVTLICCTSGPPNTPEKGFLRGALIMGYFITMIFITTEGDEDENNRWEDNDL